MADKRQRWLQQKQVYFEAMVSLYLSPPPTLPFFLSPGDMGEHFKFCPSRS